MVYTWAQERQLKFDEYRDLSSRLIMWLRENTAVMLDRNFPSTLIEMKVGTIVISVCMCVRACRNVRVCECLGVCTYVPITSKFVNSVFMCVNVCACMYS